MTEPGKGPAWHKQTNLLVSTAVALAAVLLTKGTDGVREFIGHPRLAELGCWAVAQLRVPTMEPGSQHQ